MIAGKDGKGFFAAHWDWLVALAGLLVLAAAAFALVTAFGEDPDEKANEMLRQLGGAPRGATGVEAVDLSAFETAAKKVQTPPKVVEIAETQESFMASGRRVFCEQGDAADEKKACGLPIPFGLKTCPLCGAKQPEEQKVVLDSGGSGRRRVHQLGGVRGEDGSERPGVASRLPRFAHAEDAAQGDLPAVLLR